MYEVKEQKLDMLIDRLNITMNKIIEVNKIRLFKSSESYMLNNPKMLYIQKQENLKNLYNKLNKEISLVLTNNKTKLFKLSESYVLNNPEVLYKFKMQNLDNIIEKLEVLNPMNTLKRGYAITKKNNKVISSIKNIKENDTIEINLKDGTINTKVMKVSKEK